MNFDNQVLQTELYDAFMSAADKLHPKLSTLEAFKTFGNHFLNVANIDGYSVLNIEDIVSKALFAWTFIQTSQSAKPKIKVANPTLESDGWSSSSTVVCILMRDMPFLIDSVQMYFARNDMRIHRIHSVLMSPERDANGVFGDVDYRIEGNSEALLFFEIARTTDESFINTLTNDVADVLDHVEACVDDFPAVKAQLGETLKLVDGLDFDGVWESEGQAFLQWVESDHFTFLGCEKLAFDEASQTFKAQDSTKLGICKPNLDHETLEISTDQFTQEALQNNQIIIDKSAVKSVVHRPAYPDQIVVKAKVDDSLVAFRFLGLFTSSVYTEDPSQIPIIRTKLSSILARACFDRQSHNGKSLKQILKVLPRDELFQASEDALFTMAMGILSIQERQQIKVFLRKDELSQFYSCLTYIPKDIYNTQLRLKVQNILMDVLEGEDIEFNTYFSESILARTHYLIRSKMESHQHEKFMLIEEQIVKAARSWTDDLSHRVIEQYGEEKGEALTHNVVMRFPLSYQERFLPQYAVVDVQHIDSLSDEQRLTMCSYTTPELGKQGFYFKIFNNESFIPLSSVIPILENLGVEVLKEHPYELRVANDTSVWINDFKLKYKVGHEIDIADIRESFHEAFATVWSGKSESDPFNQLITLCHLDWREVSMLRAYARYLKQIRVGFSQLFMATTLAKYPELTRKFVEVFKVKFQSVSSQEALDTQINDLAAQIETLEDINEDKVFRLYLSVLQATLRTSFYTNLAKTDPDKYIAFKLNPSAIPDTPKPIPMFEIFVYSPEFEGVHLRGGKVARGGLRWSDRQEDYRTEVLGLVKAQQVKNSVIVPVGAKGGFIVKLPPAEDRDEFFQQGVYCYKQFISGLLSLSDNLQGEEVIHPDNLVIHDEPDPYMVVAADKGTATFSDYANAISDQFKFWLGDAFASGGSVGYDHKKMGITAKGAWVSVQRHFRELGVNVQEDSVTVVGVGDMSGDVFGNGMLLSEKIKLVAAFNHLHIFIDPNPDPAASFAERKRMFELPRSSWTDYDESLISEGGAIFNRFQKTITLTPQIKERFGITVDTLTPNELIQSLLKAPVDLIWNGGIGTYIKGAQETHASVGDKSNDLVRVNADQLEAKVIGEGGNLGVTQTARIEFARKGGLSFTDFIDNSAGVDCSDHEVNIKILLNGLVADSELTVKKRNEMLAAMTEDVSSLVLKNNYRQAQAIANETQVSAAKLDDLRRYLLWCYENDMIDAELEFMPDEEELAARQNQELGLLRPEMAVLYSYTKNDLKDKLQEVKLLEDNYFRHYLHDYFPSLLREGLIESIDNHKLAEEIVSMIMANEIVYFLGVDFIFQLQQSTGASLGAVTRAFAITRDIMDLEHTWQQIESLDYKVDAKVQTQLMQEVSLMAGMITRWLVKNKREKVRLAEVIEEIKQSVSGLLEHFGDYASLITQDAIETKRDELLEAGVQEELAERIALSSMMSDFVSIFDIANSIKFDLFKVAKAYYYVANILELDSLKQFVRKLDVNNRWQVAAKASYLDEINWRLRRLVVGLIIHLEDLDQVDTSIDRWVEKNRLNISRWNNIIQDIQTARELDFAMLSVAIYELVELSESVFNHD